MKEVLKTFHLRKILFGFYICAYLYFYICITQCATREFWDFALLISHTLFTGL